MKIHDVIDGKYEILRQINQGGMSTIYLAMDQHLNKQWVIKELLKTSSPIHIQTALQEANLIKKFDHPAIPRIVDIIETKDSICIVMDYIEGKSLDFVLSEYGIPSQEQVVNWGCQILDVLIYLHHQDPPILYLDCKPSNIMLQPDGRIKMIDFGAARELNCKNAHVLGTKGYASFEQCEGLALDQRSDIYSFGATLFHLLTGKDPIHGMEPICQINPGLSSGLENIILKCTKTHPQDRYRSCEEVKVALEHYEKEENAYKQKIKKRMVQFLVLSILSVSFSISAICTFCYDRYVCQRDYSHLIDQSKKEENIQYLFQAIQFIPTKSQAYLTLINFYKNTQFKQEQSNQFLSKVYPSLKIFKEKNPEEYALLTYEIGKLYWFYYPYVNAQSMAATWFEESMQLSKDPMIQKMSEMYVFIGNFWHEINQLRNEGTSTTSMYKEYFDTMKELFDIISNSNMEPRIHLELDGMIVNALESYIKDFKQASIPKNEILSLYDACIQDVMNIEVDTDITISLKENILHSQSERRQYLFENYRS